MHERFSPEWKRVGRAIDAIVQELNPNTELIAQAFTTVSGINALDPAQVMAHLRVMVGASTEVPWIVYDTVALLIRSLPQSTGRFIANRFKIETGYENEALRVTAEGRWQVTWQIDPNAEEEDREIALDWYVAGEQAAAPIVPVPIIDYIAGCVSLVRQGLVLPAGALLSIALEATLWDMLAARGISRNRERLTYEAVKWSLSRKHDRFLVTIEGADRTIKDIDTVTGQAMTELTLNCEKVKLTKDSKVELKFVVDSNLAGFFATDDIKESRMVPTQGLNSAIEQARGVDVSTLHHLDVIEKTIVPLRNHLVHLQTSGSLDPAIPVPPNEEINLLSDLRSRPRLVRTLLPWVIEFINAAYNDLALAVRSNS